MDLERTQVQSPADRVKSQDLSLRRTQPPARVPGYDPERLLGEGAYGEVWVATERNTGRKVAVKFYTHRGGMDWSLLKREVEKLAFLSADRYVIQLIEVGWESDPPYYIMEYLGHGSLEDRLAERGALTVDEALALFREVATGLMHAHGKGVLHCDLKPANVLLDQDAKPRLCDFGQARLSDEQTPSLGTLFYMAPEQADLKQAVPDARWDVYALGALLYCMLTGEPPYRTDENVAKLEGATSLEQRLGMYRRVIESSPRPADHRKVSGVDRYLAEVVDRCLAIHPSRRYSNVQAVLNDLDEWQRRKARRPLVFMGTVGPLLLLLVVAIFAVRGFNAATEISKEALTKRAKDIHKLAATYAAPAIAGKIHQRWAALIDEAIQLVGGPQPNVGTKLGLDKKKPTLPDPDALHELRLAARDGLLKMETLYDDKSHERLAVLVSALSWAKKRFGSEDKTDQELESQPELLLGYVDTITRPDPAEQEKKRAEARQYIQDWIGLKKWLAALFRSYQMNLSSASWFITNDQGVQLARAPLDSHTLFKRYSGRDYFHGLGKNLKEDSEQIPGPIQNPHLSQVFISKATENPIVAFSVPVKALDGRVVGVLAMTVEFGQFSELVHGNEKDVVTVLVDARPDEEKKLGAILEHPFLTAERKAGRKPPKTYLPGETRDEVVQKALPPPKGTEKLTDADVQDKFLAFDDYLDPVGEHDPSFAGQWLAAVHPVVVHGRRSGWAVIVQEKRETVLEPVNTLSRTLQAQGAAAAVFVLVAVAAVWAFVLLILQSHSHSKFINALRRRIGLTGSGTGTDASSALTSNGGKKSIRRGTRTPQQSRESTR
jgi:hypothetical protein